MAKWIKAPSGLITPHFSFIELACRHCGKIPGVEVVRATAEWLERVRHEVFEDRPLHISSGCRCPEHNAAVGGASDSFHMKGMATDVTVKDLAPREVHARAAKFQGKGKLIGGLGKYRGFCHIDRGPARRWSG